MQKPWFTLETDDSIPGDTEATEKQAQRAEEDLGPRPLETPFQKDRPPSPTIKVNLNYRPGLVRTNDSNHFTRDRLFGAVTRGDPEELEGLGDYLRSACKYLTNTEYKDGTTRKTCLMKALLNLKDGINPTVPVLLRIDKETNNPTPLVNEVCEDSYYRGHTALHIAIEKRNLDLVKLLVENGADVHARACGRFFQPNRKGACFYFGELPLSLAACTNQLDVIKYLLDNPYHKARLTEKDGFGNTVLHALVMVANDTEKNTELVIRMYDQILMEGTSINPSWRLEEIVNKQGLTPLKLAVKTGKVEILKHILHREIKDPKFRHLSRKFTEWTYGPVQISLYDLSSIDSYEENSVLEILAYNNDTPNRYKMVSLEPLNQLLQHKWEDFAAKRFYLRFFSYMVFMIIFSLVAYYRPADGEPPFPKRVTLSSLMLLIGQIIVVLGCTYLFIGQSVYLWRRRLSLKSLVADSCIEIFLWIQAFLLLLAVPMFIARLEYVPLMVFSMLLGWVNMLYYTRGFQLTGIYSVMIQKAILRDLLRFLLVYGIFLLGFATAIFTLAGKEPAQNSSAPITDEKKDQAVYTGLLKTSLELFKFTIGMGDLEFQEDMKFNYFVMFLLLLFVILTYILLLNMLIALMNETVTNVSGDSESVWKLQRAIAILEIEKNWLWCGRKIQRSGCLLSVSLEEKKDERWCFRVEEVNWANWKEELGVLKEDPADSGISETESQEKSVWSWLSQVRQRVATPGEEEEQLSLQPLTNEQDGTVRRK